MAHATSSTNTVTRRLARRVAFPFLAAVALSLAGCATNGAAPRRPRPGDGIAEYRQIVEEALGAMGAALRSLGRVGWP